MIIVFNGLRDSYLERFYAETVTDASVILYNNEILDRQKTQCQVKVYEMAFKNQIRNLKF